MDTTRTATTGRGRNLDHIPDHAVGYGNRRRTRTGLALSVRSDGQQRCVTVSAVVRVEPARRDAAARRRCAGGVIERSSEPQAPGDVLGALAMTSLWFPVVGVQETA